MLNMIDTIVHCSFVANAGKVEVIMQPTLVMTLDWHLNFNGIHKSMSSVYVCVCE